MVYNVRTFFVKKWIYPFFMNTVRVILSIRSSYASDFFGNEPVSTTVENVVQPVLSNQYYFHQCAFFDMANRAVTLSEYNDYNISMLIYECSFYNCSSSLASGAVYFSNRDGAACLNKVCGFNCFTQSNTVNQFGALGSTNSQIILDRCSFSRCSWKTGTRSRCLYLTYGFHDIKGINISINREMYDQGIIHIYSSSNLNLNYSTFFNNSQPSTNYPININNQIGNLLSIKYCILAHNTYSSYLIFAYPGMNNKRIVFDNTIFLKNSGNLILTSTSTVYGSVILIYCVIMQSGSNTGAVTMDNVLNTITNTIVTNTFILKHLHTGLCEADVDAFTVEPTNAVLDPTPAQSIPLSPTECFVSTENPAEIIGIQNILHLLKTLSVMIHVEINI